MSTRDIDRAEVHRLFPGAACEFHPITLAPPLARRIVPLSWLDTGEAESAEVSEAIRSG